MYIFIENIPYLLVRIIESVLKSSNGLIWLNKLVIDSDEMFVNFFESMVGLRLNSQEIQANWILKLLNFKTFLRYRFKFETILSSVSRTDILIFLKVSASWWIFEINFDWPDDRRRLFISSKELESSKSNETVLSESIKISKPSTISSTSVVVSSLIFPTWDSNSETELWKDSDFCQNNQNWTVGVIILLFYLICNFTNFSGKNFESCLWRATIVEFNFILNSSKSSFLDVILLSRRLM